MVRVRSAGHLALSLVTASSCQFRLAMIAIEPLKVEAAFILKDLRLRALLDTPSAFSSTYEKEAAFSDQDWRDRAIQWSGGGAITYIARDDGDTCGIVGAFRDPDDAGRAHLVSMWVAPAYRGRGVGENLVRAIFDWARRNAIHAVQLLVTSNNDAALRFYQRLDFRLTGKSTPHVNDSALSDDEMIRLIAD
jgi:ribosomal protein S18 acetylase RimI-like enzyme